MSLCASEWESTELEISREKTQKSLHVWRSKCKPIWAAYHGTICKSVWWKEKKQKKNKCFNLPTSPINVHWTRVLWVCRLLQPWSAWPFCVRESVCVYVSVRRVRHQGSTQGSEQSSGPSLFEAVSEPAASERTRPEVTMTALRCSSSPTQAFPWVPSMCWIAWRRRKGGKRCQRQQQPLVFRSENLSGSFCFWVPFIWVLLERWCPGSVEMWTLYW